MPIVLSPDQDSKTIIAIAAKMPSDKARKWETQAGRLFFKHRRAAYHFNNIRDCYSKMITEMPTLLDALPPIEGDNSSYSGPLSEALFFHLDGFFEAQRSSHDCVLAYLRTADLLTNIPHSMNDYIKRSVKNPGKFPTDPPDLETKLVSFWEKTGSRVKSYRDCFNHYVSLSGPTWQQAVNMRWSIDSWVPKFYLPDNPECNSFDSFKFDLKIDALELSSSLHKATRELIEFLASACMLKWHADLTKDGATQFTLRNVSISK